jgi:hypothetical protein
MLAVLVLCCDFAFPSSKTGEKKPKKKKEKEKGRNDFPVGGPEMLLVSASELPWLSYIIKR